jgi:hypothetical protein
MLFIASYEIAEAQCVADFTLNPNQYSGMVYFYDASTASVGDTIHTYSWNFGDGIVVTQKNPLHFYPNSGNYTITLTITDGTSSNVISKQLLMTPMYPQGCQASFSYNSDPLATGQVSFSSAYNIIPTDDAISSVVWHFGDGTTSTSLYPVHNYSIDTSTYVTYQITTTNGCTTSTSMYINPYPCNIGIQVNPSTTNSTQLDLVVTNAVQPLTVSWQQASNHTPWHTTPSSQMLNNNLTLQAEDTTTYIVFVSAGNGCASNAGYFSLNGYQYNFYQANDVIAEFVHLQQGNSTTVDFSDYSHLTSNNTPPVLISSYWDFGDGTNAVGNTTIHNYQSYGSYTITHVVTESNNFTDTIIRNISISNCNYNFTSSITASPTNNFILNANVVGGYGPFTYSWKTQGFYMDTTYDWNSGPHTQSITANVAAFYAVKVMDNNGCFATAQNGVPNFAILAYNPHFQDSCSAKFAASIGTSSAYPGVNNAIVFMAEENQWGNFTNPRSYTWICSDGFIDSTNSNGAFLVRPYIPNTSYVATLIVSSANCSDTSTINVDFNSSNCNMTSISSFQTNNNLFAGQYPLKITGAFAGGHGSINSYTYLWNNGSTAPFIYAYTSGTYCVTATDSLGCSATNCYTYYAPYDSLITLCGNVFNDANNNGVFDGGETPITGSNIIQVVGNNNTFSATTNGVGHYSVNVPAGTYQIKYISTVGHNFTTPSTADSIAVYSNVVATYGNNQCDYNFGVSNNTSFIGGKLFYDTNSNGQLDAAEVGISYQPINAGAYTVFTDSLGNFNFNVVSNTYQLTYTPQNDFASYTLTTPGTININAVAVGQNFSNNNFGIHSSNSGVDLGVNIWPASVVNNGFPAGYTVKYYNNGTTSINNTITMVYDSTRVFQNATIPPSSINTVTHTITWQIPFVYSYSYNYLYVEFLSSVALTMNTPVVTTVQISNAAGNEISMLNNTSSLHQLSVSSFDPNDKLVVSTNSDHVNEQNISSVNADQEIEYVIHFQNMGNYYATNIRIVDEMSTSLDENSYVLLGGSHNCQVTRLGNVVTYKFDNIMLPAESDSQEGSQGFVAFKINAKSTLQAGDLISDQANIYFDYNLPVATNYANILMVDPYMFLQSESFAITNNSLGVFPNPMSDNAVVKFVADEDSQSVINLTDRNGKRMFTESFQTRSGYNYYQLQAGQYPDGLYFVEVITPSKTLHYKVNIIKK